MYHAAAPSRIRPSREIGQTSRSKDLPTAASTLSRLSTAASSSRTLRQRGAPRPTRSSASESDEGHLRLRPSGARLRPRMKTSVPLGSEQPLERLFVIVEHLHGRPPSPITVVGEEEESHALIVP